MAIIKQDRAFFLKDASALIRLGGEVVIVGPEGPVETIDLYDLDEFQCDIASSGDNQFGSDDDELRLTFHVNLPLQGKSIKESKS